LVLCSDRYSAKPSADAFIPVSPFANQPGRLAHAPQKTEEHPPAHEALRKMLKLRNPQFSAALATALVALLLSFPMSYFFLMFA
jgi:hypothetical protein